ncbi:hypothetical protein D3C75_720140 [compost metagenome]
MRVAQVIFNKGVVNATGQRFLITTPGPDALAFFTHDDGCAGILAGWQNALCRDFGVTQELERDILIVFAGFGIIEDISHLLLMRRAQHKGGIVEGVLGE